MNPIGKRWAGNDVVLLWTACIVVLVAGLCVAFAVLPKAIDDQHALTSRITAVLAANADVLRQRPELERESRAVDERVRGLDLGADRPALVARFVQTAARIALAQRVSLDQIDVRGAASPLGTVPGPQTAGGTGFDAIGLDVTLAGSYHALLAAIRELAAAPLPMEIEVASIERSAPAPSGSASRGPLSLRLHLILQHLTDAAAPSSVARIP